MDIIPHAPTFYMTNRHRSNLNMREALSATSLHSHQEENTRVSIIHRNYQH
ncbi:hypothetical protein BDGGKGIB_01241 [Nodularia sphaerocarpa UHCC 0038]|nr:hypothetical protein BDGGKGIB_01241 [Nodularia sphaerocarpa UHCC 0038]